MTTDTIYRACHKVSSIAGCKGASEIKGAKAKFLHFMHIILLNAHVKVHFYLQIKSNTGSLLLFGGIKILN